MPLSPRPGKALALPVIVLFAVFILALPVIHGPCVEGLFSRWMLPSWTVLAVAVVAGRSRFPLMALLVCLLWAPVHYALVTEPCTPPRSQGAGGLIYLLTVVALPVVLAGGLMAGRLLHWLLSFFPSHPDSRRG